MIRRRDWRMTEAYFDHRGVPIMPRLRGPLTAMVLVFIVLASVRPAAAQSFNNADAWDQRRYGGKICFTEHTHYGESPSWPTKKGARRYAIRSWEEFTTWEYGKAWGRYRRAIARTMNCEKTAGRWICRTEARPCRLAGRRRKRR